jgi:hypothetical protein
MDANKDDEAKLVAHAMERRAAQRHPILQRCIVRPANSPGIDGWKCIAYDVSTIGIGVAIPYPLTVGTILAIEPADLPGAGTVEARIVRVAPLAHLWLCGCELTAPLNDTRLKDWLAGSASDRPTKLGW